MSVSARRRRLQPWQALTACLVAILLALGVVGGGVLGVWQGLSENATNMVTAAAASAVAVHSVHCSGLTPAYPTTCTDAQGTVTISWTAVTGSTGITVQRATSPTGPYTTIATLPGTAITYTDPSTSAAYNTQYYYEVYSGTASWMPAADVDMALSLDPTSGIDDTIGTGGTSFSGASLTAMQTAGGATYAATNTWGAAATLLGGQTPDWMGCANTSQCWAYTYQGHIWASTNGGATWTEQTTPSNPIWFGGWFENASDGWATGANGTIVATTNGGTTWTAQTSGSTQELTAVDCVSTTQCWVSGFGGVMLVSSNGGSTWTAQTSTTTSNLDEISCVSASDCWASGAGGTIIATTNGGTTWAAQASGTTEELFGISCVSTTQCWAAGAGGVILATTNGTTWTAQTSGTTDTFYAVECYSATACWAGGQDGVIYASTNGTSWTAQVSGTADYIWGFECLSSLNCYAAGSNQGETAGVLLETTNGGSSWFAPVAAQYLQWNFSPTVAAGAPVTSAVVTLVDDASATPGAGTTTYVEVSANSGATWTAFQLPNETTTMAIQTVSVVSVINSAAAVSGLELRYVVSNGSAYKSTFDLVHVDIN
ncbi:MAG: hypothetical protein ABSE52_03235 [Candidatus Dormibacteria bacterium]|jgi:photosystem II stability/assembly factor-like uncharacterized protein